MSKEKCGKLIPDYIDMIIPNTDYYSVLLSDSELRVLLKCLCFCYKESFYKDFRLSGLFDYLESYLNRK